MSMMSKNAIKMSEMEALRSMATTVEPGGGPKGASTGQRGGATTPISGLAGSAVSVDQTVDVKILGNKAKVVHVSGAFDVREARALARRLSEEIHWKQREIVIMGHRVLQPRLTSYQADDHSLAYTYSRVTLAPEPWHPAVLKVKVSQTQFDSRK